jgi:hypothetical protein
MLANFGNTNDYLPLFNSVLITDLFVLSLLRTNIIKSEVLNKWYSKYNLSAVMADVLIILIVLILARFVYYYVFDTYSLPKFIMVAVGLQVVHDLLFYALFSNVPRGANQMLDTFKDYANEMSYKAVIADSGMMVMSCLIASYLVGRNVNTNIIVLISFLYLLPYLLY